MGAIFIRGSYLSTAAYIGVGVKKLSGGKYSKPFIGGMDIMQEHARSRYNDDDSGYSGDINTILFHRKMNYDGKTESEIEDLIEKRMHQLEKREGEIISVGKVGFVIISTSIEEEKLPPFDTRTYLRKAEHGPAVLLTPAPIGSDTMRIVTEGKVTELRVWANSLLRENKYNRNYYIVNRERCYLATGEGKFQKKTTRVSNEKTLVLPVYKYIYYGWAAE